MRNLKGSFLPKQFSSNFLPKIILPRVRVGPRPSHRAAEGQGNDAGTVRYIYEYPRGSGYSSRYEQKVQFLIIHMDEMWKMDDVVRMEYSI